MMIKVKCVSIRESKQEQITVGKCYWMDESSKWKDIDGDEYVCIYMDKNKQHRVAEMLVSHFIPYVEKLRVWWIPQVDANKIFYVPVQSVEDGKMLMDVLAAYDAFQLQNRIKPDYVNMGGVERYNDETQGWEDWYMETDDYYYEDVDDYCESKYCEQADRIREFGKEIMNQIDWNKINAMTK